MRGAGPDAVIMDTAHRPTFIPCGQSGQPIEVALDGPHGAHAVPEMEAKLGLPLLTRTTRSVMPTEAGERLIETLRPALDEIDDKLASLTELPDRPAGTVRITSSAPAARAVLWPVIDRLTAENPDI